MKKHKSIEGATQEAFEGQVWKGLQGKMSSLDPGRGAVFFFSQHVGECVLYHRHQRGYLSS